MLSLLLAGSPSSSMPSARAVANTLLPHVRARDDGSRTALVSALTELVRSAGVRLGPATTEELTAIAVEMIADQSNEQARYVGVRLLGRLASYGEQPVVPYAAHPTLLPTLLGLVQNDVSDVVRRQTMKTLGRLGALDPYMAPMAESGGDGRAGGATDVTVTDPTHPLAVGPSHEDYYLTLVLTALVAVLVEPSLGPHHAGALDAVLTVFRSLRTKCVPFLPQLMPAVLSAVRAQSTPTIEFCLEAVTNLVGIVGEHVRPFVDALLDLAASSWPVAALQPLVIDLITATAKALEGAFRKHVAAVVPMVLQALGGRDRNICPRALRCVGAIGVNLDDHQALIVPAVCAIIDDDALSEAVRRQALRTLETLARSVTFASYATQPVRSMQRVLEVGPTSLHEPSFGVLEALVAQLGSSSLIFVEPIEATMLDRGLANVAFMTAVEWTRAGGGPTYAIPPPRMTSSDRSAAVDPASDAGMAKLPLGLGLLRESWQLRDWTKDDDWRAWIKRLSCALLRASPHHVLRACAAFAEAYPPLARELFDGAFVACYLELSPAQQVRRRSVDVR